MWPKIHVCAVPVLQPEGMIAQCCLTQACVKQNGTESDRDYCPDEDTDSGPPRRVRSFLPCPPRKASRHDPQRRMHGFMMATQLY